jgi:hypothetical protein
MLRSFKGSNDLEAGSIRAQACGVDLLALRAFRLGVKMGGRKHLIYIF